MGAVFGGIDGFHGGWLAVRWIPQAKRLLCCAAGSFVDALEFLESAGVVGVDIPIGLPDHAEKGGRECDRLARQRLGRIRGASVFSPPVRAALTAVDFQEASALQQWSSPERLGLSIQCWNIVPKIREVDDWIDPERQERVREVHPELAFWALNGKRAAWPSKKTTEGRDIRRALLESVGFENLVAEWPLAKRQGAAADDLLDACAAAWSAQRIASGRAEAVPAGDPPVDGRRLKMVIGW